MLTEAWARLRRWAILAVGARDGARRRIAVTARVIDVEQVVLKALVTGGGAGRLIGPVRHTRPVKQRRKVGQRAARERRLEQRIDARAPCEPRPLIGGEVDAELCLQRLDRFAEAEGADEIGPLPGRDRVQQS